LTGATFQAAGSQSVDYDVEYAYDAMGNRTRVVENGSSVEYVPNELNQYTRVGTETLVYDADGNLVQRVSPDGTVDYQFDAENRLVKVSSTEEEWLYAYDALGRIARATTNGETAAWITDLWGLGNRVGQYDGTGARIAAYTYGLGLAARETLSGGLAFYTFDAAGNTSALMDEDGIILNAYRYAPFGGVLAAAETVDNPFQFGGQLGVGSGAASLLLMRARFYAPDLGRFMSEDPLGLSGGQFNLYSYARNDPVNLTDPSGLGWGCGWVGNIGDPLSWSWGFLAGESLGCGLGNGLGAGLGGGAGVGIGGAIGLGGGWSAGGSAGAGLSAGLTGGLFCGVASGLSVGWSYGTADGWFCGWSQDPPRDMPKTPKPGGDSDAVGSRDPNQKLGPNGVEAARFVAENRALSYRIDFENDPTATASVQSVSVTDTLDRDLDWTSFELSEIGFGDVLLAVPAGTQQYQATHTLASDGQTLNVRIDVRFDLQHGRLEVDFATLDPATDLPPSIEYGFLPPEDGTGRGQGHIGYLVRPKTQLATGTEIRNVAVIQFDFGETIATNQVDPHDPSQGMDPNKEALVTLDTNVPESQVAALPAVTYSTDFLVSWAGRDDADGTPGSGIATFDIYMSDDGAPYTRWQHHTPDRSAMFRGQVGHTYAFYSLSTDNVGYRESAQAAADAQTFVSTNHAPIAQDDLVSTNENAAGMMDVLANDTDVDADPLSAVPVTAPVHGALVQNPDGALLYTPALNFNREDTFSYVAHDGLAESNVATVMIMVNTGYPWHNGVKPLDVNDDGHVSPIDALQVINELNRSGPYLLPSSRARPLAKPFYDVNRDRNISPIDALLVINHLNRGGGEGEAGESFTSGLAGATWWPPTSPGDTNNIQASDQHAAARPRRAGTDGSHEISSVVRVLDLLFAEFDERHHSASWESAPAGKCLNGDDLEEFLHSLLRGGADEAELLTTTSR
jgi:RHS repeat-associated protein